MRVEHDAIARTTVAVIVIVIIVLAGAAYYFTSSMAPPPSSTTSLTSSASIPSTTSTASTPQVSVPSNITVDEIPAPVSVDPSASYDVPAGEILQNVYQELVFYNGSSGSSFVGELAKNWTSSSSGLNYTFNLWPFEAFSDGTPLNASTVWFSFYRTMMLNQGISFYISEYLSINGGTGFEGVTGSGKLGLIELPFGIQQALSQAGYSFSSTNQTLADQQAANDLASILSHFSATNSTIQSVMSYPNQAVAVAGTDTVKLNLDYAFSDFFQTIAGDDGAVTDPVFVDGHGGVQIDTPNAYLTTNALGSGPYVLQTPIGGSSVILTANPNYWAEKVPAADRNVMLSIPKIHTVVIQYQSNEAVRVSDIKSGAVQISQVEVPDLHEVNNVPGITVHIWGPTATIDFVAIDAYQYPYNITNVRLALEYGINATAIQSEVYGGFSRSFVGPLDPAMAYYNSSIAGPAYQPDRAISLLAQAGFSLTLPNGTKINSGGTPMPTLNLIYSSGSNALAEEGLLIQSQLSQIGVKLNLQPESFVTLIESYLNAPTSPNYPALQLGGNTPVFLGPTDPAIYLGYCPVRCHHGDPAYLNNTSINQLIYDVIHTSNPVTLQRDYNNMTLLYQQTAQYVWLDDFTAYTVASSSLQGFTFNAALLGNFYASIY